MSPSRRPGLHRPRPARTPGAGSSRHPASAPAPHDALDWTRAVFAGVEGVLLSWVLVLVPALIAYVVTAAAPSLGDASWQTAVRTATAAWLVGAGGTIETAVGGPAGGDGTVAVISLVPLGLSLLTVLTLAWTSRHQGIRDLPTAAVTAATVVVTHLALSLLAPFSAGRLRLVVGSLFIAALGLLLSRPGALRRRRWRALVSDATALAARALAPLAAFGLVLVVVAAVLGRDEVSDLHGALAQDPVSSAGLLLAQLAFLPDLVVWAVAFAAGPGFALGAGTSFTSTEVVSAPLPAVPFLGGLPHPGDHALAWLAVPIVLIGVAVGAWATRRRPRERRRDALALAGAGTAGVALAVLLAALAASGSIGPGRMAEVGANPLLTAGAVALEVGAGMVAAMLLLHRRTRATVRGWFSRGTPAVQPADEGAAASTDAETAGRPDADTAGGPDDDAATHDSAAVADADAGPETEAQVGSGAPSRRARDMAVEVPDDAAGDTDAAEATDAAASVMSPAEDSVVLLAHDEDPHHDGDPTDLDDDPAGPSEPTALPGPSAGPDRRTGRAPLLRRWRRRPSRDVGGRG